VFSVTENLRGVFGDRNNRINPRRAVVTVNLRGDTRRFITRPPQPIIRGSELYSNSSGEAVPTSELDHNVLFVPCEACKAAQAAKAAHNQSTCDPKNRSSELPKVSELDHNDFLCPARTASLRVGFTHGRTTHTTSLYRNPRRNPLELPLF